MGDGRFSSVDRNIGYRLQHSLLSVRILLQALSLDLFGDLVIKHLLSTRNERCLTTGMIVR